MATATKAHGRKSRWVQVRYEVYDDTKMEIISVSNGVDEVTLSKDHVRHQPVHSESLMVWEEFFDHGIAVCVKAIKDWLLDRKGE